MSNLYELKNDFGVELRDAIIGAFRDYDIIAEGKSAGNSPEYSSSVGVDDYELHDIEIYFLIRKKSFDELEDSDYPILEKFVRDIVNIFMDKHSKTCDELKLKTKTIEVDECDGNPDGIEVFVQFVC